MTLAAIPRAWGQVGGSWGAGMRCSARRDWSLRSVLEHGSCTNCKADCHCEAFSPLPWGVGEEGPGGGSAPPGRCWQRALLALAGVRPRNFLQPDGPVARDCPEGSGRKEGSAAGQGRTASAVAARRPACKAAKRGLCVQAERRCPASHLTPRARLTAVDGVVPEVAEARQAADTSCCRHDGAGVDLWHAGGHGSGTRSAGLPARRSLQICSGLAGCWGLATTAVRRSQAALLRGLSRPQTLREVHRAASLGEAHDSRACARTAAGVAETPEPGRPSLSMSGGLRESQGSEVARAMSSPTKAPIFDHQSLWRRGGGA